MKKLFPLLFLLFAGFTSQAQFEVKINPVLGLFEVLSVAVEHNASDNFGVELDVLFGEDLAVGYLLGKYYFSPKLGCDKFYGNAMIIAGEGAGGLGFGIGYKLVSVKGILFDFSAGVGRDFTGDNDVIGQLRAQIGYRF